MLNELLYAEEMTKVARLFIEDLKQYLVSRKPDGRRVLLIVDEFSAIADGERMARMVEIVRSCDAAVVLAPQAYQGMGGVRFRRDARAPKTRGRPCVIGRPGRSLPSVR